MLLKGSTQTFGFYLPRLQSFLSLDEPKLPSAQPENTPDLDPFDDFSIIFTHFIDLILIITINNY